MANDGNSKSASGGEAKQEEENPHHLQQDGEEVERATTNDEPPPGQQTPPRRTPFTNLSQVDADLALARTLQEQERAFMMLRMNNEGSDYGSSDAGSFLHDIDDDEDDDFDDPDDESDGHADEHDFDDDEHDFDVDAFDVHANSDAGLAGNGDVVDDEDEDDDEDIDEELDPSVYSSDEAYARALQEAEEREMAARLLALARINDREAVLNIEDHHGDNSQDTWVEVDPDELSYEELLALGDVVGTESRGLSADIIASLPSVNYKTGSDQNGSNDSCVICRLDYEDGETLTLLSCKHSYHPECINNWLKINKVCPVCSMEVSTSGHS